MTYDEVIALLETHRNKRGVGHWQKMAASAIGKVEVDYGDDNSCQALDIVKSLTSDYVLKKFGKG